MKEIYNDLFSQSFPSKVQLVEFALKRHGFCSDNGYSGVTYPEDLDEYDRIIERQCIPDGMVNINYWDGSDTEVMVSENDYLIALKSYLILNGDENLASLFTVK